MTRLMPTPTALGIRARSCASQGESAEESARLSSKTLLTELEDRRVEMENKHKLLHVR